MPSPSCCARSRSGEPSIERQLNALVHIAYGGEAYPPGALSELMACLPHATFVNVYGPAEVNAVTNQDLDTPPTDDGAIPLGTPWAGVELRIVDENEQEVPLGTKGELWISAPTCMSGYWNEPELTDRSFVEPRGRSAALVPERRHRPRGVGWISAFPGSS